MQHRADINGLRALAVLPVLFFHLDVPGFSGGYAGVDVFFVISGYLICAKIQSDLRAGRFSLGDFYKRRILRLFPALFAMLFAASLLAYAGLLPSELKGFSASLAAAAGSVSNMYFAFTDDYFEAAAATKPLLHTWSLGVEEQFYIVAPLAMMAIWRFAPRRMVLAFVLAALASYAFAWLVQLRNPVFAFYFAPCRAWQLALGALLAFGALPLPRSRAWRDVVGALGLALLVATLVFGSAAWPLPAVASAASLAALLIIASGEATAEAGPSLAGRLLSQGPLVGIGLISYSLYLWHWPLIVFQRGGTLLGGLPAAVATPVLLVLTFAIAYLSWRFIEQPFRRQAPRLTSRAVLSGGGLTIAGLVATAGLVHRADGLPERFPVQVDRIAAYLDYDSAKSTRAGRCFLVNNRQSFNQAECLSPKPGRRNVLLVGDSHAAHLWHGLAAAMPATNLMQANAVICRPIIANASSLNTGKCPRLMRLVFDEYLAHQNVDQVLLAASWKDEDLPALAETLDILRARGVAVTVLGPIVEYREPLPRLLANAILRNDPGLPARMRDATVPPRDLAMRALSSAGGATYVSLYAAACPGGICEEYASADMPLQFDAAHLTEEGSVLIGRRIVSELAKPIATAAP